MGGMGGMGGGVGDGASPGGVGAYSGGSYDISPSSSGGGRAAPSSSFMLSFKLLLTNDQCGALIGKGGSTVIQLQERYGVTLKLGGLDDLFPGTFFRPAICRGSVMSLRACLEPMVAIFWQVRRRRGGEGAFECLCRACSDRAHPPPRRLRPPAGLLHAQPRQCRRRGQRAQRLCRAPPRAYRDGRLDHRPRRRDGARHQRLVARAH